MADERLRNAEREAAQGGGKARAQLLVERMRSGAFSADQIRLAAYLGDASAQAATGVPAASGSLSTRALGLEDWGVTACVVAAVAAARLALDDLASWPRQAGGAFGREELESLESVSRWLDSPCAEHAQAAHAIGQALAWPEGDERGRTGPGEPPLQTLFRARCLAAETCALPLSAELAAELGQAFDECLSLASQVLRDLVVEREDLTLQQSSSALERAEEEIWRAAKQALLVWFGLEGLG